LWSCECLPRWLHLPFSLTDAHRDLQENSISNGIPDFSALTFLAYLSLSKNSLSGTIPLSLFACTSLQYVALGSGNGLSGTLPDLFGNLTSLVRLLHPPGALRVVCDVRSRKTDLAHVEQ